MNVYVLTGVFGIISGFVAALADVPPVKPGKESDQMPSRKPQKWWAEVPESRFTTSFGLSFLGQPGTYLTMWMLATLISDKDFGLGFATLWLGTTVMVIIAIANGSLEVPKICLLLNPIPSTIILLILKKLKVKIIGALGVGFMMFAILLTIAGLGI